MMDTAEKVNNNKAAICMIGIKLLHISYHLEALTIDKPWRQPAKILM